MTIALWTILAAIALPIIMAFIKKIPLAWDGKYNNASPRAGLKGLRGVCQRASWAEQNSFEILPAYIAAVLVAHIAGADPSSIDQLALLFIVTRILYCICYITNWAALRSIIWVGGLLCIVGLFIISA